MGLLLRFLYQLRLNCILIFLPGKDLNHFPMAVFVFLIVQFDDDKKRIFKEVTAMGINMYCLEKPELCNGVEAGRQK